MYGLATERYPNERIQIIPYGNLTSAEVVNKSVSGNCSMKSMHSGNCFVVRGSKKKTGNTNQNVFETKSGKDDRYSPAWKILGNIVSGFIFIAILTWAIPVAFARVAETRKEIFNNDQSLSMVQQLAEPGASDWNSAGSLRDNSTNPVLDSMIGKQRNISSAPREYGVTSDGSLYLPESIAREIDPDRFGMPDIHRKMYYGDETQGKTGSDNKKTDDAAAERTGIRVSGIICGGDGNCTAVINNEVFMEGDIIGGSVYVREINSRRVTLVDAGNPGFKYQIGM